MKIKKYNEFMDYDVDIDIDVKKLMEEVEHDCANKSDLGVIVEHKSYKEIVKNSYDSISIIIENIDRCHVVWFRALNEITGEYPDKELYDKGIYNTSEVRKIWKKWASENGY